ncbi:hypothetical protein FHETE_4468 [Fusarium heterosporum]|uniref:Uncharacterized protein n=1 Tax=Fusarium heterosporum TaxID=42747 RepID=A0A8H5WSI8_FUSHE|nr:hypothetical protein FHETE_4468 [Fusarium heterosporum]
MACNLLSSREHYMEPLPLRAGKPFRPMFFSDHLRKHRPRELNLEKISNLYNLPETASTTAPLNLSKDWSIDLKSQVYAPRSPQKWNWDELGEPEEKKDHRQMKRRQENEKKLLVSNKRAPERIPEIEPLLTNTIDLLIPESPQAKHSPTVREQEGSPATQVIYNTELPDSSVLSSSRGGLPRIMVRNGEWILNESPVKGNMDITPIMTPVESPVEAHAEPGDIEEYGKSRYCTRVMIIMLVILEVVLVIALRLASAVKRCRKD